VENGDGGGEAEVDEAEVSGVNTPTDANPPESVELRTNGDISPANNQTDIPQVQLLSATNGRSQPSGKSEDGIKSNGSGTTDTTFRIEAMSQEREALRTEVEQLRKALQDIQGKHLEDVSIIKEQHTKDIFMLQEENTKLKDQHLEEMSGIRKELEETEEAKEQAETQYQNLLGRVNTIKSSLGERLKADKQELAEAKDQIEELESQNETLSKRVRELEGSIVRLEAELNEYSKELSSLRNRHNLSQQNWLQEREDLLQQTRQLKDEAEAAKEAMGDWEVLAMEERSIREGLTERIADMEEQFSAQKEAYEAAVAERDSQAQAVEGLRRALQEIQEARKQELRETVESAEEQLQALKKLVLESDERATLAEAVQKTLHTELDRLRPFEKEVKEKNLLIGKLRHEAIVLNDHLTKALRFLKKAKPEDNIDRQIVTNHFLQFLALDRSDPKKFQILQLIAALLNWTDEQKEQAGLARPGTAGNSLRLPSLPFHRTPSTPLLTSEFFTEPGGSKESLADLWTSFLERSAEEGSTTGSRSASVGSPPPRPETSGGSS